MSLLEMLGQTLTGDAVEQISNRAGADRDATAKAVAGALPILIGALSRNTSNAQGAQALDRALERDHMGVDVGDLAALAGRVDRSTGQGILKHVLGGRRSAVEGTLGQMSGIDANQAGKILEVLAPIVMGYLAKEKKQEGVGADGLSSMLDREAKRAPSQGMDLASRLLDRDGDGQVADDLLDIGGSLLGSFLGGKR